MPLGKSSLATSAAKYKAVSGVNGDGFKITGQPTAIAGAILWSAKFKGKLKEN